MPCLVINLLIFLLGKKWQGKNGIGKERYALKCNLANIRMSKTRYEVYAKVSFVRVKGVYLDAFR